METVAPVSYVTGFVQARETRVPVVSTRLSARDIRSGWKVRWDIGRMRYRIDPGLYAVGTPTDASPVLVTANYKLTFDAVRKELAGIDAWILVLDTKGINVWCAAGKGTFGTRELERRILAVRLDKVVSHRTLILPQLGAPGVAAHEVKAATGFRVKYGPVRACDIRDYLARGQKKDEHMRTVEFNLHDRLAIAPAELRHAWPILLGALASAGLLALPFTTAYAARFLAAAIPLVGAVLVGSLAFPALLPYLPFRAFSLKGATLGIIWGLLSSFVEGATPAFAAALTLISAPIVAFISMNFTGSSTYTCQPGATLEVRRGIVPMAATLVAGLGLAVLARVLVL
jgi:hypothetical protein